MTVVPDFRIGETASLPTKRQRPRRRPGGTFVGQQSGGPDVSNLTSSELTAWAILKAQLDSWGLSGLYDTVTRLLKSGLGQDAVMLQLQGSDTWKQRFAGNEARRKANLPVLDPGTYLATEDAYRQVLRTYGLPATYDSTDQFAKWIGEDKSAAELDNRLQKGVAFIRNANPYDVQALKDMYGMNQGQLLSALVGDQQKSTVELDRLTNAALIGGSALKHGLTETRDRAEQLYSEGYSQDQIDQGLGAVADVLPGERLLGSRFGQDYTQADAEDELIRGMASARRKRLQLNEQEQAQFAQGSGATSATLGSNAPGGF